MRTTCADRPLIRNMTGSPAFSAAGQNQSAVSSVGHPSTRTPSIPGCFFHVAPVTGWATTSGNGKDPASFATPGAIHQGVGHASMANEMPFVDCSMEHEGIVGKLHGRQ